MDRGLRRVVRFVETIGAVHDRISWIDLVSGHGCQPRRSNSDRKVPRSN